MGQHHGMVANSGTAASTLTVGSDSTTQTYPAA